MHLCSTGKRCDNTMSKVALNLDDMEKLDAVFGGEKSNYGFDNEQINQLDPNTKRDS